MIKNDSWIRNAAANGMLTPFEPKLIRQVNVHPYTYRVLSYGTSSYGYDIRLSDKEFWIFNEPSDAIIDPKNFDAEEFKRKGWLAPAKQGKDENGQFFLLPGLTVGLGVSFERIKMPPNITAEFIGKSTYARICVSPLITPAEAGWEGYLTIEIFNGGTGYRKIYANEGIAQALFFEGEPCHTTYLDRQGKYQNQPQQVVFSMV